MNVSLYKNRKAIQSLVIGNWTLEIKKHMRKHLLILLILFTIFAASANAEQILYNTFYWVDGSILPPTNDATVSTDNRIVIFYLSTPESGYASDVSGTYGMSGQKGKFMINAMEDFRMPIAPNTYKVAIVKGSDGYGANPQDMAVSGKGYDTASNITLAYNAGVDMPDTNPLPPIENKELPKIESIWFNNRLYQKKLVAKNYEFIISEKPKVSAKITGNTGIDISSIAIIVDEGTANAKTYKVTESSITSKVAKESTTTELVYTFDFEKDGSILSSGEHMFTFTAGNSAGVTAETADVKVMGGDVTVVGIPLTYPSPLHLTKDNQVILEYGLSKDANIEIYIFDITGKIVKKLAFGAGTPGGVAGGTANPNKVN